MNSIELEFETKYGQQKRRERYVKKNAARRRKRLQIQQLIYPDLLAATQDKQIIFEQTTMPSREDDNDTFFYDDYEYHEDNTSHLIEYIVQQQEEQNDYETNNMYFHVYDHSESIEQEKSYGNDSSVPFLLPLHNYTNNLTFDYCENFTFLARQVNLSKTHTNDFLSFIKSALPVPNNMPATEKELLSILDVQELFTKRSICLICGGDFDYKWKTCPQCCFFDTNSIPHVYDTNVELIIKNKTKDIPFGTLYQELLKQNDYQNMISMLLHVDGVSITRSTKLKMWMFSGCIVELPPKLRNRRCNMVVISIWVGYTEPRPNLWLKMAMTRLKVIKIQGMNVMNKNHKLIVFGITGDCPALSLICNFINHNGYFCCWLCFIKGQHVGKKSQYRYAPIVLRTTQQYFKASNKAERTKTNIYGHLGQSVLENILDVPLPNAIVPDYLHVTLLGHAKALILSVYHQLKPIQRKQFNIQLKSQQFPHFFNRKIRSIDNFAFVKGTEVRNLLFYGLLPNLNSFLSTEQFSHLAMYVCAIRLLHSGHVFGDETSEIGDRLFSKFYKDHELFYTQLQSFKLHLHAHYSSMYETHGSLCNLGCFGQESFIGFVSANYHGTGIMAIPLLIITMLTFASKAKSTINGSYDRSSTLANDYDYVKQVHSSLCNCDDLNSCCVIYRRFIIHDQMFHSLIYNRRQNSISYFVQYSLSNDVKDNRFGSIELFFICNNLGYAVIKYHRVKELYSDAFKNSSYYHLLRKPIDSLYFILEKNHCEIDIVQTDYIKNHCIVVEKDDYLFVTTISSYNEHD